MIQVINLKLNTKVSIKTNSPIIANIVVKGKIASMVDIYPLAVVNASVKPADKVTSDNKSKGDNTNFKTKYKVYKKKFVSILCL
jgi:hypothetical protein